MIGITKKAISFTISNKCIPIDTVLEYIEVEFQVYEIIFPIEFNGIWLPKSTELELLEEIQWIRIPTKTHGPL